MHRLFALLLLLLPAPPQTLASDAPPEATARIRYLVEALAPGVLRDRLQACLAKPQAALATNRFSLGHRGAPFGYPEHSAEGYRAAAAQGAGRIECDATPTRDGVLVCRHAQCDLHSTTDILLSPLASRCRSPFSPAEPGRGTPASARCCTSDLSLAEFRQLRARHDRIEPTARTLQAWLAPGGAARGTLVTHAESIALFRSLGVDMVPELKPDEPDLGLPAGLDRATLARRFIGEYREAGIPPERVMAQSFLLGDIALWLREFPDFGKHALWLDGRFELGEGFDHRKPETWQPTMGQLRAMGIRYIGPPMPVLLDLDGDARIVPSAYARAASGAGFGIVAWTLERSGPLADGGGLYYASVRPAIRGDGDLLRVLDILVREVGIEAMFSDWPATTTFYANCLGLRGP
jgi:glycerophosphoryl diester phosphodiesterase